MTLFFLATITGLLAFIAYRLDQLWRAFADISPEDLQELAPVQPWEMSQSVHVQASAGEQSSTPEFERKVVAALRRCADERRP